MVQATLAAVLLSLFPLSAEARSTTVLQLQRVNFKPEKRLVYDLNYDSASCEVNAADPFDAYYRDNATGQRLEKFSTESMRYFGPAALAARKSEIELRFKALEEIQQKLGIRAQILIRLEMADGKCTPSAEITYSNKRFTLEKINISMTKAFGIPNGVEWVQVKGRSERGPLTDCVAGKCN